ncbi:MAG: hypothetical protein F7B18_00775 [Desulfurococcales archaeon]|nr:hypothetical protein [Desulfurococcales archaeon]
MKARVKVALIGFGNVGRHVALELGKLGATIVSVSSSRGSLVGVDPETVIGLARRGGKLHEHPRLVEGVDPVEAAVKAGAEVAMITIPPSYQTGEPNRSIYYRLIDEGVSIITADKTVLAKWYRDTMKRARSMGVYIGYRATVAAGIPAIDMARGLRGREVEEIEAVLNSTTNYLITLVKNGMDYQSAVEKAIEDQLAEPDPRVDTHGLDPAAKLAILASTLGYEASLEQVEREPLDKVLEDPEQVERLRSGEPLRYIAYAELGKGIYKVEPRWLPPSNPLAGVTGIYNGVLVRLEGEQVLLSGPVGPAWRTARVMVTDLLDYMEYRVS